jgi:hypothetical protein
MHESCNSATEAVKQRHEHVFHDSHCVRDCWLQCDHRFRLTACTKNDEHREYLNHDVVDHRYIMISASWILMTAVTCDVISIRKYTTTECLINSFAYTSVKMLV